MPPPPTVAMAVMTAVAVDFQAVAATWCIIRSEASEEALQRALDYACWAGADCEPIKSSGLCFLPNTIQAHASYAFNSYYQRKATAPGSCDFSGTATVAKTDPSYILPLPLFLYIGVCVCVQITNVYMQITFIYIWHFRLWILCVSIIFKV